MSLGHRHDPVGVDVERHSICGTPRGAGMMPTRWNFPASGCRETSRARPEDWISTLVWLSAAVLKVSLFRVGMVRSFYQPGHHPPRVSMPRLQGRDVQQDHVLTSPPGRRLNRGADATTSSGLTPCAALSRRTPYHLLDLGHSGSGRPPGRPRRSGRRPAGVLERLAAGAIVRWIRSSTSCSSFAASASGSGVSAGGVGRNESRLISVPARGELAFGLLGGLLSRAGHAVLAEVDPWSFLNSAPALE